MLPDKIKIAGLMYDVNILPDIDEDNSNVDGKILYSKCEIRLKAGGASDYMQYVLWHEIMHGIFEANGIKQEDATVDRIARTLYQVICDNPELFKEVTP
jgi:hypothetical protein